MNIQENQIIGQLVAHDYRTASVFKKYGIENFSFEMIEEVEREKLDEREKYWIVGY